MPLRLALAISETGAGHRQGALEKGGGYLPPFQCIPCRTPPPPMVANGAGLLIAAEGAGAILLGMLLSIGGFRMIAVHSWRLLDGCRSFLTSSAPEHQDCVWG